MNIIGASSSSADSSFLHSILPESYEYVISEFSQGDNPEKFNCTIRLPIFSREDALNWLKDFEVKSLTTWKVEKTFKECSQKIIFKKEFHCQHNTKPRMGKTPHEKHTNCPAKMTITVTVSQLMERSKDKYNRTHPCKIYIRFIHNHNIAVSAALKHRTPFEDVRNVFEDLFSKNHCPSSALSLYKFDLKLKFGDDYCKVASDGAICPTQKWVYDLYYRVFKKEYGDPDGEDMIKSMENYIKEYNNECNDDCAASLKSDIGFTVALCSPLMKRVHINLNTSKEIGFLDSSGNMDRHNSRIFVLMCASPIGALPLGIFITYSESEESINQGLTLLTSLFPETAFYGQNYPSIIITDDCAALRNSIRKIFPNSKLFLCIFHVLQNMMRFIWLGKNNIKSEDRLNLYRAFQKSLYIKNEDDFKNLYAGLYEISKEYENLTIYLQRLEKRAHEWALCFRQNLTRGNNTNNYCEATFRVIKDKVFQRLKSFNIIQLFHFLVSKLDTFYSMKINDVINSRIKNKEKYYFPDSKLSDLEATVIGSSLYTVKNSTSNQSYSVDAVTNYCTCYVGSSGAPCKHQFLVSKKFQIPLQFLNDNDTFSKFKYHKIAYGNTASLPSDWFDPLNPEEPCSSHLEENASIIKESVAIQQESAHLENNAEVQVDWEKYSHELKLIFEDINERLFKSPSVYGEPIKKFIDSFKKCKTESSVISALHTFGKYNGMPFVKRGKNLQGGKVIGVQPTAIARRKIKIGGRMISKAGRPPKSSYIPEHAYGKRKMEKTNFPQIQTKMSKPHSLSLSIENNS